MYNYLINLYQYLIIFVLLLFGLFGCIIFLSIFIDIYEDMVIKRKMEHIEEDINKKDTIMNTPKPKKRRLSILGIKQN